MSDGELVRQALSGHPGAYEELVHRWAARVLALCHARLGRAGMAEDLAQEALLRGYVALRSLSNQDKFGAWLCGIATRACLDWLKAKERTQVRFSDLRTEKSPESLFPDREWKEEPELDHRDEVNKLAREVELLPEEYRKALMLYYYQDLTYEEIAQILGVSPATVNARLTKARVLLRRRMSKSRATPGGDA
jgi:RNA polymerase sigma-70 factor (ECF subfamily)